jgi:hypothetical protein
LYVFFSRKVFGFLSELVCLTQLLLDISTLQSKAGVAEKYASKHSRFTATIPELILIHYRKTLRNVCKQAPLCGAVMGHLRCHEKTSQFNRLLPLKAIPFKPTTSDVKKRRLPRCWL